MFLENLEKYQQKKHKEKKLQEIKGEMNYRIEYMK